MRAKRVVGSCIAVAALLCFGVRVYQVNASAFSYPLETHGLHDELVLDGAFAEYSHENTKGYSIVVEDAERMSCNEFVEAYGAEGEKLGVDEHDKTDLNAKTLLVLTVRIKSDKGPQDERGYLDSIGWSIQSVERPEWWVRVDYGLLDITAPQLEGAFQLSVKPGTEFELHVPFSMYQSVDFPGNEYDTYRPEIKAGDYRFVCTKAPVRKVIDFSVA